jgi:hypothetical protein
VDGAYNNFCPGSLGIVDPADVSKVVFEGAVARLAGVEVVGPIAEVETHAAAGGPAREQVSADIRYPVPDRFAQAAVGVWAIIIRWRGGDGRVVARLMETPVPEFPSDPGTEATRSLLAFDSDEQGSDGFGPIFGPPEPYFRTGIRALDPSDPPPPFWDYMPDIRANTYHFEVTLTGFAEGPAIGLAPLTAVAAIGIHTRSL